MSPEIEDDNVTEIWAVSDKCSSSYTESIRNTILQKFEKESSEPIGIYNELDDCASLYTESIRDAILRAYEWFRKEVPERQIVDSLKSQGLQGLVDLAEEVSDEIANRVTPVLTNAWNDASNITHSELPSTINASCHSDTSSPIVLGAWPANTLTTAESYKSIYGQNIKQDAVNAIINSVDESLSTGINPKKIAKKFRDSIELTQQQIHDIEQLKTYMVNLDPSILNSEVLCKKFVSRIRNHIQNKIPFSIEFINTVTEHCRQQQLKRRAESIARTEAMRAMHSAEFDAMGNDPQCSKMRRYWSHAVDERVRPVHRQIPLMNPYGRGMNEPFDSPLGPIMYPGDPGAHPDNTINCRCAILYVYNPKYPNMTYAEAGFQINERAAVASDVTGRRAYELFRNRGDVEAVENLEALLQQYKRRLAGSVDSSASYWEQQISTTEDWLKRIYYLMQKS